MNWIPCAAIGLCAALAGCGAASDNPERPGDVYLITVDTLRADHTSAYGYERPTTPWLESLARRGVRYARCTSNSSWTVPSLTSLVTGQHAWSLGTHAAPSLGAAEDPASIGHPRLPDHATTLAERFRDAGYSTVAITANRHLDADLGWSQGFEHYASVGWGTVDQLATRLGEIPPRSDMPRFMWIHAFDPHDPYLPTPDNPWSRGLRSYVAEHGRVGVPLSRIEARDDLKSGRGLDLLTGLYDGEIRDTDRWIAWALGELGASDRDTILFASDHGEEFWERGHLGHRRTLHDESVHVPCVLASPGLPARVEQSPVDLLDMHQSLLTAAGISAETEGRDVRTSVPTGDVFSQLVRGNDIHWAVTRGTIRQIERQGKAVRYDLGADPGETTPLPPDADLTAALVELRSRVPVVEPILSIEARTEELEALGYVEP